MAKKKIEPILLVCIPGYANESKSFDVDDRYYGGGGYEEGLIAEFNELDGEENDKQPHHLQSEGAYFTKGRKYGIFGKALRHANTLEIAWFNDLKRKGNRNISEMPMSPENLKQTLLEKYDIDITRIDNLEEFLTNPVYRGISDEDLAEILNDDSMASFSNIYSALPGYLSDGKVKELRLKWALEEQLMEVKRGDFKKGYWYKWLDFHPEHPEGLKYIRFHKLGEKGSNLSYGEDFIIYDESVDVDGTFHNRLDDCGGDDFVLVNSREVHEHIKENKKTIGTYEPKHARTFVGGAWYKWDKTGKSRESHQSGRARYLKVEDEWAEKSGTEWLRTQETVRENGEHVVSKSEVTSDELILVNDDEVLAYIWAQGKEPNPDAKPFHMTDFITGAEPLVFEPKIPLATKYYSSALKESIEAKKDIIIGTSMTKEKFEDVYKKAMSLDLAFSVGEGVTITTDIKALDDFSIVENEALLVAGKNGIVMKVETDDDGLTTYDVLVEGSETWSYKANMLSRSNTMIVNREEIITIGDMVVVTEDKDLLKAFGIDRTEKVAGKMGKVTDMQFDVMVSPTADEEEIKKNIQVSEPMRKMGYLVEVRGADRWWYRHSMVEKILPVGTKVIISSDEAALREYSIPEARNVAGKMGQIVAHSEDGQFSYVVTVEGASTWHYRRKMLTIMPSDVESMLTPKSNRIDFKEIFEDIIVGSTVRITNDKELLRSTLIDSDVAGKTGVVDKIDGSYRVSVSGDSKKWWYKREMLTRSASVSDEIKIKKWVGIETSDSDGSVYNNAKVKLKGTDADGNSVEIVAADENAARKEAAEKNINVDYIISE